MQELIHEDFDRRIKFCELIEARGNYFINNIVFSEASFELEMLMEMLIVRISDIGAPKSTLDER